MLVCVGFGVLIACFVLWQQQADRTTRAPLLHQKSGAVTDTENALGGTLAQASGTRQVATVAAEAELRLLVRTGLPRGNSRLGRTKGAIAFELRLKGESWDSEPFYKGQSDDSGECWVEVPPGLGLTFVKGVPEVEGRIAQPGYQQRVAFAKAPKDEGAGPVILLACVEGGTVRGRVLDENAMGVDATVSLRSWIAPNGVRKLGYGSSVKTSKVKRDTGLAALRALGSEASQSASKARGHFAMHLTKPISGTLIAQSGGLGLGALPDLELDPKDLPQDLVIVLRGPGRIAGQVTDGSGNPAPALSLLVLLAELDDPDGSFVVPEPAASERLVEGKGRLWATLETGAQGQFKVSGLRPDEYVIRARLDSYGSYPLLLSSAPVLADGSMLQLKLSRPHFLVQLRRADGSRFEIPANTEKSVWGPTTLFGGEVPSKWPESPRILLFEDARLGPNPAPSTRALGGKPAGPGDFVFEVSESATYWIGAQGKGFDGSLSEVFFPLGGGQQVLTLTADESLALGRVEVLVFTGTEEPKGPRSTQSEFSLALESLERGTLLLQKGRYDREQPLAFEAPVGRYRIVASGESSIGTHHGILWRERDLGRAEAFVDLREGEPQQIELHLDRGATLKVKLSGSSNAQDFEAVLASSPHPRGEDNHAYAKTLASQATLSLSMPGRRYEPVYRSEEWTGSSAAGTHRTQGWPLGETHTSIMVSAGKSTLIARMPGGRIAQRAIELLPGKTQELELHFED